jgi:hypothetical protein
VGYNAGKPAALYPTPVQNLLRYGTQRRKNIQPSTNYYGAQRRKNIQPSTNYSPLYPTTEESLLGCIPQRRKTSSVVSHNARNAAAFYPTTVKKIKNLYNLAKINI